MTENRTEKGYPIYKGLQAPLDYKGFKGKFIFLGALVVIASFFFALLGFSMLGGAAGIILFVVTLLGGLMFLAQRQKKGQHIKKKETGIFIVVSKYHIRKLENEQEEKTF